jgi:hypothetical protein
MRGDWVESFHHLAGGGTDRIVRGVGCSHRGVADVRADRYTRVSLRASGFAHAHPQSGR